MSNNTIKTILLIEDSAGDARSLREMFKEQGSSSTELNHVECMSEAESYLAELSVDVILLDLGLPDSQGLEAVRRVHAAAPHVPLVVLTGLDDEPLAIRALQQGAQDYLVKGQFDSNSNTRGLFRALSYAVERKRMERLKDDFVSSVSHELRTPLTSIFGSLGLLMGQAAGNLPDSATRLLAIAYSNSQRLVRLVSDILDIEKMEAGQVIFNLGRVKIRPLVEQVIESNRGFAETYGVRVLLEDPGEGEVRTDPDRLAQVITNLLSNAIKFSPMGQEVAVAIEKTADLIRISVRDHGPGISADFKPRVFERFAQADVSNTGLKGGTGLGLSIAKQIVERLDGKVGFADAPGGGAIFHIELPCWEHSIRGAIDQDAMPDAMRILLCEDDRDAAELVRKQLKQVGFATDFAHTAGDALASAVAKQYHTILVDLRLPDSDGISLIQKLRALPQHRGTPIIVVSADPDRGRNDARSSKLNVLGWLNKPAELDQLMGVMAKPARRVGDREPPMASG